MLKIQCKECRRVLPYRDIYKVRQFNESSICRECKGEGKCNTIEDIKRVKTEGLLCSKSAISK